MRFGLAHPGVGSDDNCNANIVSCLEIGFHIQARTARHPFNGFSISVGVRVRVSVRISVRVRVSVRARVRVRVNEPPKKLPGTTVDAA